MNWVLLKNSLAVSGLSALLAVPVGFGAALFGMGLERRCRIGLLFAAIVSLALPPFLVTNCWLQLLGEGGLWRAWLPFNILSLGGAVWIFSLLYWPVSFLM